MTPTTDDRHSDGAAKAAALQWLVNRLRWEQLLTGLHNPGGDASDDQPIDEAA
jgi:hypothetical protein